MGVINLPRPIDRTGTLKAIEKRKCEIGLAAFVRAAWHIIEPGQPYVHGWHIDFICLPGHIRIQTKEGSKSIKEIVETKWDGEVLSFNHSTGLPEWRRVLAHMESPGKPLFTVTSNGVSVPMTGNHPVFVDGVGYTPAALVKAGQRVVQLQAVRSGVQEIACADRRGHILQPQMLCGGALQSGGESVLSLWRRKINKCRERLLGLPTVCSAQGQGSALPSLRNTPLVNPVKAASILQSSVHREGQAWAQEPSLCGRKGADPISVDLQVGQSQRSEAGWWRLLRMFCGKTFGRAPHRQGHAQQRDVEPCGTAPGLPSRSRSEVECFTTIKCNVSSVKSEVWIPDTVYNIGVEGNNNYFADGLLVHNCAHLEAITNGQLNDDGTYYNRLLVNVPPGTMKSLLIGVFWPAWEWGPRNMPHLRYVCASHSLDLAIRDSLRMRRLVTSDWYQGHWGDRVQITGDQNAKAKFETTATGSRQACAFTGITGYRGDRVIVDDPHSVDDANSDQKRSTVTNLYREAVTSRLNVPEVSAVVCVMQRLHEADVSGVIIDQNMGYDHIMLPMRFDPNRACVTRLGYADPREIDGELLFEDRFPLHVVERDEAAMGPYATAGQYAQSPEPRGGGIIKDNWWKLWDRNEYPGIEYVIASLDTAYTTKSENDPSALTIWGVFSSPGEGKATRSVDRYGRTIEVATSYQSEALGATAKVMLMYAWQDRLEIGDLVVKVEEICNRMKVDLLLIENKAAGHSVAQEIRRVFNSASFAVQMYDPKTLDKVARLYSIQHIFSEGMVYAPNKDWAEMVIRQTSSFPRGAHDDLVDTVSMGLKHLRDVGMLTRAPERMAEMEDSKVFHGNAQNAPLYNA